jgi:diguanylate cyclase (GGDEF)-like protein/PAS domain S-box-containing protein
MGQMLLGSLLIHALLIPFIYVGILHLAEKDYQTKFVDHARAQSYLLVRLMEQAVEPARIIQIADDLVLSGQVAYVDYIAVSGRKYSSAFNPGAHFREDFFFGEHDDHVYSIAVPIHSMQGVESGKLRLAFDEQPVEEQIAKFYRFGLFLACGYIVLTLLFIGFFGHLMTKSIRQLRDASRRIASGHTDEQLSVHTGVAEVSSLAQDLEFMRQELVHREHEIALRESRQRAVLETAAEGIITVNPAGKIESFNKAAESIFGCCAEDMLNTSFADLLSAEDAACFLLPSGEPVTCVGAELSGVRKDGERFHLTLSVSEAVAAHSRCYTLLVQDISERRAFEARLAYQATHDALTGLPNRELYNDRLVQALAHAAREEHIVALLFLDLDRFKYINDTLGHDFGDELLKAVGERIKSSLRQEDTLARIGGDEFTLILPTLHHVDGAAMVAQNILNLLERPFSIAGQELFVSGSIGITFYPFDDNEASMLVKNADTAMYVAKSRGGNNYQFYSEQMNAKASRRLEMERQLRHAQKRGELLLHYQPQVEASSMRIVGVEALLRWQHPDLGLVPPSEFIPLAEETGLIIPISEWVLRTACAQGAAWYESGLAVSVGVNLSARQFAHQNLPESIRTILVETGFPAHLLDLELTEGAVMQQGSDTIATLQQIRQLGVSLSLDDFGTGYSSLSYLQRFPIDTLKIDRSFVQEITGKVGEGTLAAAIIAMAHSLSMKVIGEGVESAEQLAFLQARQCQVIQGFYFSKPLPCHAITDLLRRNLKNGEALGGEGTVLAPAFIPGKPRIFADESSLLSPAAIREDLY